MIMARGGGVSSERVYVIPLRDAYRAPRKKRAKVAVRLVREFVERHLKAKYIKVSPKLNELIWSRSSEKPPRRVRVRVVQVDEDTVEVEPLERIEES